MRERIAVSRETQNSYHGIALTETEISVLEELEGWLQERGHLHADERIPVLFKDEEDRHDGNIGFAADNDTVTALSMRYCALTTLPESIGQLGNLQELDVTGNQLTALPTNLSQLTRLTALSMARNQLDALPEFLWQLTELRLLNVAENQLSALSERIGDLTRLHTLDIGHNALTALPESLGKLTDLTFFLYISNNQLTTLPASLFEHLSNLLYLNITDNHLTTLPEHIGNLTNLKELRLYNNALTVLPASLRKLTRLKELHIQNNRLATLPPSIGNLTHLKELDASDNMLAALPASLGALSNLTRLNLRNNKLRTLPASLEALTRLTHLDLRNNRLQTLPACLEELPCLEKLDLRWNKLSAYPGWLLSLEQRGCTVYRYDSTDADMALFFDPSAQQYLSSSVLFPIMMDIFTELARHSYPGKVERLVVLLNSPLGKEHVEQILNATPLTVGEVVNFLERYGRQFLENYQQTPQLASVVIRLLYALVKNGYTEKMDIFFILFDAQTSEEYLEQLLTTAQLTTEESKAFFQRYGSIERYPSFLLPVTNCIETLCRAYEKRFL